MEDLVLFKIGALFTAGFIVFSASALISFVLRHTQLRMLRFTGTECAHDSVTDDYGTLTLSVWLVQLRSSSEYEAAVAWDR